MVLKLGILLPKQKRRKIKLPDRIAKLCAETEIEITEVDVDSATFGEQGPFDVFLHKVTDFYNECSVEETKLKILKVKQYTQKFSTMSIIDDFEVCELMLDRKYQTEILKACELTTDGISVFVPKIMEISPEANLDDIQRKISEQEVKFPILAKPLSASLQASSHTMSLIFCPENLSDLPKPCLLQEFCNHGGIVYKVYVVGSNFSMCERPSIKDIDCTGSQTLIFDTRNVSKTGKAYIPELHESDPNLRQWKSCDENPDMLNRNAIRKLCERLQETTGMKLFGFDILVEKKSGNYALIDVNQFPGYDGINKSHFPNYLVELILNEGKNKTMNENYK